MEEVVGEGRVPRQARLRVGGLQGEMGSVQHEPRRPRSSVEGVTSDGVAEVGEVKPHLVGAPGAENGLHEAPAAAMFEQAKAGLGAPGLRVGERDDAAKPVAPIANQPRLHGAIACREAPANPRDVSPVDGVRLELRLQVELGALVEGNTHEPRRALVDAVHRERRPEPAAYVAQYAGLTAARRRNGQYARGFENDTI